MQQRSLFWGDLTEGTEEIEEIVGRVRRFIFEKNLVEIELDEDYVEYARQNK